MRIDEERRAHIIARFGQPEDKPSRRYDLAKRRCAEHYGLRSDMTLAEVGALHSALIKRIATASDDGQYEELRIAMNLSGLAAVSMQAQSFQSSRKPRQLNLFDT